MILQINQLAFSFEARERDWFFGYIHDMIAINVNEKVGFQRTETRKITNTTKKQQLQHGSIGKRCEENNFIRIVKAEIGEKINHSI